MAIKYASLNSLRAFKNEFEKRLPEFEIEKLQTPEDGYVSSYQLKRTVNGTSEYVGDKINIPKDLIVRAAELKTVETADQPVAGYVVGQKYIDMEINVSDDSGTTSHIYLLVNDLVDVYTAGNGIEISSANEVSLKVESGGALSFDATTGALKIATASKTTSGILSAEDFTTFANAAEATITIGAPTGDGNAITQIANVNGAIVPTLGITALQESDLVEITDAEVAALWGTTPTPTPTKYAVTFNSNEGSPVDPQEVEEGKKVTKPADPTKDGVYFAGWFSDEELNSAWDFDNGTVSGAMTLYAKWSDTDPNAP